MSENSNPSSQPSPDNFWQKGDPLPSALQAEIDPAKFDQYSMNPDNPRNLGKWQAFEEIGYDVKDLENRQAAAQQIIDQLRRNLPSASAIAGKPTLHGCRFEVKTFIRSPIGKMGTLVTIWQVDLDRTIPRLITNWLEVHRL
ncbi:MAG: hypothetical protein KME11_06945 [Timaviella obliquedivisa GSE-PSE-MK23-08B]|jgi:hypothetical protein|nr:hypothetical protein [Timaviella obliquedivisa GSE-PSE-MK23-08B]